MTTRQLVLIRHSKAAAGNHDRVRPLADRGIADARELGRRLVTLGIVPDRVVVSNAVRARQTWAVAATVRDGGPEPVIDDRVYENTVDDLLAVIHSAPASVVTLVLVGHNPSMAELAYGLDDGAGDGDAREAISRSYPTSGVCVLDVPGEWADVGAGGATVTSFAAPRG